MRWARPRRPAIDGARLLVSLLGRREGPPGGLVDGAGWAAVTAAAEWHGLQPALREALVRRGLMTTVPDAVRRRLDEAHVVATLRAEARRRQLHELLGALRDADVDVIVLKGAYLGEAVYRSPTLRPMSDVDLLLAESRTAPSSPALACLTALGYRAGPAPPAPHPRHAPPLSRPGRLPVEPHYTIEPCVPPFTMPRDAVWSRSVACRVADVPARALAPEDLLLHLAVHMGHSHVFGTSLVSLCDVLAWAERFGADADWDAVVGRARGAGVSRFVYAALALARDVLGATVPERQLAELPTPADDWAVRRAAELLVASPFHIVGARAVTSPGDTGLGRVWRVARALLVTPALHPLGGRLTDDTRRDYGPAARDGHLARWSAIARMLAVPAAARTAAVQVGNVRALRRWGAAGA